MTHMRVSESAVAVAPLAGHLALAPVAFAVTEGPTHALRFANAAFRQLVASGQIALSPSSPDGANAGADIRPLLDRAYRTSETVRGALYAQGAQQVAQWNCTVWPMSRSISPPEALVIEIRDAAYLDGALARQRLVTERLLLGALREQDVILQEQETARHAVDASRRSAFLATASRELAASLDEEATRAAVTRRRLPREGSWCIVDIIGSSGGIERLAIAHPDPEKQALARTLVGHWDPQVGDRIGAPGLSRQVTGPVLMSSEPDAALLSAAHGEKNLEILRSLGVGALLVVPLLVRDTLFGTITFVSPASDAPFSREEIALASDIADRCAMALDNARLYREADTLRAAADEANRAKSAFLGNMSHELMTPLNAIGGYAELIELGLRGPVTEKQRIDLSRIKQNQQHLLSLISEILTFVRSESGRMEYHFAEVSIRSAIDDVAEMLQGAADERDLVLDRDHVPEKAVAWADPDRVRQILLNLVMNAVKYSDTRTGRVVLRSGITADTVFVQVIDFGPGIPPDKLREIFQPFVQLARGLIDRKGGVGLGLTISRDLARAMQGDLIGESTIGLGSTFTLTLPRAPISSEPSAQRAG